VVFLLSSSNFGVASFFLEGLSFKPLAFRGYLFFSSEVFLLSQ
jgi:hypothetical protein